MSVLNPPSLKTLAAARVAEETISMEYVPGEVFIPAEVQERMNEIGRYLKNYKFPLHKALKEKEWEIVRLLVERKANVNTRDEFGDTPLHVAARVGNRKAIELLLDRGALDDIHVRNNYGDTPLHAAARASNNRKAIELLLDRGALDDIHARDNFLSIRPCMRLPEQVEEKLLSYCWIEEL
jgi:hypothetical protein